MSAVQPARKIGLIRPEALEGKAYARLAHPLLIANPSLVRPLLAALATCTLVVATLAFLPLTRSYRGYGVVSASVDATVVRATRPGQIVRVAGAGTHVAAADAVSLIEQPLRTEDGRSPAEAYSSQLGRLARERASDLRLLEERFALSRAARAQSERSLKERLGSLEASIRNQSALVAEAEALFERFSGFSGYVTRLDMLALTERKVSAQNRLLDLQGESRRLQTELAESTRATRISEIDHVREQERLRHEYQVDETALLEKEASQAFTIPSPTGGQVLAVYKKRGDWVSAGDEIALVGERESGAHATALSIQVPGELANLLAVGQTVRVWPNVARRSDPPLAGSVSLVEQRTPEGYRLSGRQPGSAPGSFVAHVALEAGSAPGNVPRHMRVGSEVEMEIVFGSRRLYEVLLPQRVARRVAGAHRDQS